MLPLDQIWTSFTIGLLATTSPCILPLYPGFLAYLSAQTGEGKKVSRFLLGVLVLAGVMTMMVLLGGLIALLAVPLGSVLSILLPIADLIIISFGILLILDKNPFKLLPQIQVPGLRNPYGNAFLYGMLYGPISLPCSGPLLISIFAVSLTAGEALARLSTFFWFGLGFGLPLLALALIASARARTITRWFAEHAKLVNLIGGILLLGIGIYDLWVNWEGITLFFGN